MIGPDAHYASLETEAVLPSQFFLRQPTDTTGERRLLFAVLTEAVECFQNHVCTVDRRKQRLFREAQQWLMSDAIQPFSFRYICDVFALDPSYLRQGLRRWQRQQLAAHETRFAQTANWDSACAPAA